MAARRLRVKAFTRRERESYGYVGYKSVSYQQLQEKRWWGWETIDQEEVPSHVRISMGAFGDTGYPPWRSKFNDVGTWDHDGMVKPHPQGAQPCS